MSTDSKYQLVAQIINTLVSKPYIEISLSKDSNEIGITDRKTNAYITIHELINDLTSNIK